MPEQILKSASLPERPASKLTTTADTNAIRRAINELGQSPQLGTPPPRIKSGDESIWLVWDKGPNDEADYTDHRYWLRRAYLSNADDASVHDAAEVTEISADGVDAPEQVGMWITATNLAELLDETHNLAKGTPVMQVRLDPDTASPQVLRWIFQSGGTGGGLKAYHAVKVDGDPGGGSPANCTFIYHIYNWADDPDVDDPIAEGIALTGNGNGWRALPIPLTEGTVAQGFFDDTDTFIMIHIDEVPANFVFCSPPL